MPRTILGVAVEEQSIFLVTIRRRGDQFDRGEAFRAALPLDWPNEALECGRRVAAELAKKGIRSRKAVVLLEPRWLFVHSVPLPSIPAEDIPAYAELQAERCFPLPAAELSLTYCKLALSDGIGDRLILAAIPQKRLTAVQQLLQGLGVEPVSISVEWGLENNAGSKESFPQFCIKRVGRRIDLIVAARGLPLYYTSLPVRQEDPALLTGEILRELRLTIARLNPELRGAIKHVVVVGGRATWNGAIDRIDQVLRSMGLRPVVEQADAQEAPSEEAARAATLLLAATRFWKDEAIPFEFLPERLSKWQLLLQRYSQGKARVLLEAAGSVVAIALLVAFVHSRYVARLDKRWSILRPEVERIAQIQHNIRQFRPWFDPNPWSLRALKVLTEAFPDYGSVWAKSVRYKFDSTIEVIGLARDPQSLQQVTEALRSHNAVQAVKVQQVRGQNPIEFRIQITLKVSGDGS